MEKEIIEKMEDIKISNLLGDKVTEDDKIFFNKHLKKVKEDAIENYKYWIDEKPFSL